MQQLTAADDDGCSLDFRKLVEQARVDDQINYLEVLDGVIALNDVEALGDSFFLVQSQLVSVTAEQVLIEPLPYQRPLFTCALRLVDPEF